MREFELKPVETGRFRVSGELTLATVAGLVGRVDAHIQGDALVLDLSGVTRSDSAGLALLMEWERRALARGAKLHYTGMPAQLASIAELSDLADVLPLVD
ncbi:MAG: STAS domain-containing protein [Gammaproteobacteria bacterium]